MREASPNRQSFLGSRLDDAMRRLRVGIVGVSGGGSHIVQQLAHMGFAQLVVFDPDLYEATNHRRMVLATRSDIASRTPKVEIARRRVAEIAPGCRVEVCRARWQKAVPLLRSCDLLFGCVDSFRARSDLEAAARRYLIPLIDIGMTVQRLQDRPPYISGQVALSLPGGPCLRCLGVLSDARLAEEANQYGEAGPAPQVVFTNGALASAAIGVATLLITNWARRDASPLLLVHDGNRFTTEESPIVELVRKRTCPHYNLCEVGPPLLAATMN